MLAFERRSGTFTSRGWPLNSKKTVRDAVVVRLADGEIFDDQSFARLDLDGDLIAAMQAIEKRGRGDHAGVARIVDVLFEIEKNLRIEQIGKQHPARSARGRAFSTALFAER